MTPTEEQSVEDKVNQLIDIAASVKHALNVRSILVTLVGVVMIIILTLVAFNQADLRDIAEVNRDNGVAIKNATGPEAQARSAKSTIDILRRNAVETDCRSRRQQVRLPAPDPSIPCDQQTDASVYPGVLGQPARG